MKKPRPKNAQVDMQRVKSWLSDFTGYRHVITEDRIDRWIKQFAKKDRDLAARVLDSVDFISAEQINKAYQQLLNSLPGWSADAKNRKGRWFFVAYSQSAGESGDEMLHKFRTANNMSSRKFNELFVHKSELISLKIGKGDTVIFIDDFSGTGNQICESWAGLQELLTEGPNIYLFLIAASKAAIERVKKETDLQCVSQIQLREEDNIFSDSCRYFDKYDQTQLLIYCKKADAAEPYGYRRCGFVVVFAHTCPNNTIPILHASKVSWEGLFRRYD